MRVVAGGINLEVATDRSSGDPSRSVSPAPDRRRWESRREASRQSSVMYLTSIVDAELQVEARAAEAPRLDLDALRFLLRLVFVLQDVEALLETVEGRGSGAGLAVVGQRRQGLEIVAGRRLPLRRVEVFAARQRRRRLEEADGRASHRMPVIGDADHDAAALLLSRTVVGAHINLLSGWS